jgi:hypothetical protein
MPVTTLHPQYEAMSDDWRLMSDSLAERKIKEGTTHYLPKTAGQIEAESQAANPDNESGLTRAEAAKIYEGYLLRAEYPLWVKDSLRTMMGLVGRQEPTIKLPRGMANLEGNATADGFGLHQLFLRVVSELLTKGRMPLLADFDAARSPYISTYTAETAPNWREANVGGRHDLVLTVLSEERRSEADDEYEHASDTVYRVLDIQEGRYRVRVLDQNEDPIEDESTPGKRNGDEVKPLSYIPLVFVGSTDNSPDVDEIPLLSMARSALKYYTLSADYFTSLHYTAHPQPWVSGLDDDTDLRVTGPMAAWMLPENGQAQYLEFRGAGIEATRKAMMDQRNAALEAGARVVDVDTEESGDARRARQDDQHTSLYSVAVAAASGIEQVLKYLADWMGLNPDEVEFTVEPKFSREEVDAAMLQIVANMVMAGEVPRKVLFQVLRKAQLTELTDEQLEASRESGTSPDDDPDSGLPPGGNEDD